MNEFEHIGPITDRVISKLKPKRSFVHAGIEYQSKAAVRNRIKKILGNVASDTAPYQMYTDIPGVDGEFLLSSARHYIREFLPEIIPEEIVSVQICWVNSNDRKPYSKPHRGYQIKMQDGRQIDIGQDYLLHRASASSSEAHDAVREAARYSIQTAIIKFKEKTFAGRDQMTSEYPKSSEIVDRFSCHVDHFDLTFDDAIRKFLLERGISEKQIELKWEDHIGAQAQFVDTSLEQAWIEFHDKNCHLRIISARENLSLARMVKHATKQE